MSVGQILKAWKGGGARLGVSEVATWLWREGQGEQVLCLYGLPASGFLYRKSAARFSQKGFGRDYI
jgi:hypothetical protein